MLNKKIVKAFTLLELIVVIVVLGILAMLAVPTFNTVKEKSADSVAVKNAQATQRDYDAQEALGVTSPVTTGSWVITGNTYTYTAASGMEPDATTVDSGASTPDFSIGTKASTRA